MLTSKLALTVVAFLSAAISVNAHGYVQEIKNGGQIYTGYLPYSDPYYNPPPERIVRKIPGNGPVTDLSLIEYVAFTHQYSLLLKYCSVQCNGYTAGGQPGSAPAPIYATVAAGSAVALLNGAQVHRTF